MFKKNWFKIGRVILVCFALRLFSSIGAASDIDLPCDFYGYQKNGIVLTPGDVITVKNPRRVTCGSWTVTTAGEYGFLTCQGNNPVTPEDEGAMQGEVIKFFLNGVETKNRGIWQAGGTIQVDIEPKPVISAELIVKVKPGIIDVGGRRDDVYIEEARVNSESLQRVNAANGLVSVESLFFGAEGTTLSDIYLFRFSTKKSIRGILLDYRKEASVIYIEPNYRICLDGECFDNGRPRDKRDEIIRKH